MKHKCSNCGNDSEKIIGANDNKGLDIVCRECGNVIDTRFRCVECKDSLNEDEAKGYIRLHKDGQLTYYSIYCDKCKKNKQNQE